jgi:glycosyltransferase involved in cell wall biosynthesis
MTRPRVALVSIGIGRVQRGFERYFRDLFAVLRDEIDVTLFKSGGPADEGRAHEEVVPPFLRSATAVARALPVGRCLGRTEYHRDCIAFALAALPKLRSGAFDVVHMIDPPLASVLARLKSCGLLPAKLLFTEGCVMPPALYPKADHIHHVALAAYEAGLRFGHAPERMTLAPCGVHTDRFPLADERAALRRAYGIADETFVVLSIAAIKRDHKRVDHLIREVAKLDGDVLLWLDGNPEDDEVVRLAAETLGSRCRLTHVPSAKVPELYRLADVMALASLSESFSLSLAEAMCSGTPVLAHDTPHFRWLVQEPDCLVDMSIGGALAARLESLRAAPMTPQRRRTLAAAVRRRFDWSEVAPLYVDMYRRLAAETSIVGTKEPGADLIPVRS